MRSDDGTAKDTNLREAVPDRSYSSRDRGRGGPSFSSVERALVFIVPAGQPVINRPAGAISATVRWSDPLLIPRLSAPIHRVKTNTHASHHGLTQPPPPSPPEPHHPHQPLTLPLTPPPSPPVTTSTQPLADRPRSPPHAPPWPPVDSARPPATCPPLTGCPTPPTPAPGSRLPAPGPA